MSAAPLRPLAVSLASVVALPRGSSIEASSCRVPMPMPPLRTPVPPTRTCSRPAASCGSVVTSASIAPARSAPKSAPTSCNRAILSRALPDVRSRATARSVMFRTALAQWPSKLGTTMPPAASRSNRPASESGCPWTSPLAVRLPPAEPSGRNSMVEEAVVVPASPGRRTESCGNSTERSNLPVWPLPLPDRPNEPAPLATFTSASDQVWSWRKAALPESVTSCATRSGGTSGAPASASVPCQPKANPSPSRRADSSRWARPTSWRSASAENGARLGSSTVALISPTSVLGRYEPLPAVTAPRPWSLSATRA